jgi:phenylpropionate dioxygenase-like ring-hydroxylating dioxygenase large terminal subunit
MPAIALSPPNAWYTSPDHFAREMEHVHRRNWFLFGRADELPDPGDYRAIETVGGPVIVLRGEDGLVNAFANTCRHRGSLLLEGAGNRRAITCPYHAWSYRLDGTLIGAPSMQGQDFRMADHGLRRVRTERWGGFVFLNFDDGAPSLADHMGDMDDLLASHKPDDTVCTWRIELDARCNWKLLVENAIEAYHTGTVHAATVGAQRSVDVPTRGAWVCIQVLSAASIAVLGDGPAPLPPIPGLSEGARRGTYFTMLQPTTQFACAQDCIWWLAVRPVAADRSVLTVGGCFPRATAAMPDFGHHAALYYDRWERVAREDVDMLEKQQIGLGSIRHVPGPLSVREAAVAATYRWLEERLG